MGKFDDNLVYRVQQANDIVEVVSEHISLVKKGREMVGVCPFHEDHRPSMYVNNVKQIFKCFACGAGGDVFKFIQMRENLTFPQAIERLAKRANIELPKRNFQSTTTSRNSIDPNRLAKANNWAADHFQKNLFDKQLGLATRKYIDERKINDESVKKWRIGLAGNSFDDMVKAAELKKIPMDLLAQAGLVVKDRTSGAYIDKFVNRLMFTITDVTGRMTAFGGRVLSGTGAKYINSPTTVLFDKSNSMYGLEQARHSIVSSGTAVVVEGYTDCIMAHQFGCENVVATLGTSFTTGHARLLRRYAQRIVLVFDSDVAGTEASNRALEICLNEHIDIKVASVPQGKDPCEFLLIAGRQGFEELAENAVDVFQFKWNRLMKNFDSDQSLVGRKRAIDEFLQAIAVSIAAGKLAAIDKGLVINRLSRIIGLTGQEINAELTKKLRSAKPAQSRHVENQKVTSRNLDDGFVAAQREILEILLNKSVLFETIKEKITLDVFTEPILREIAEIVFETINAKAEISVTDVLAKTESVEAGNLIVELAQRGEEKANFTARLAGTMKTIERYQGQKKISEMKAGEDKTQLLEYLSENAKKQNPHSVGLI